MKHRLLKLGVFLMLGAIVNVAVAFGCACIEPNRVERELSPTEIRELMASQRSVDWAQHPTISAEEVTHVGQSRIEMRTFLFLISTGWPLHSLYDEYAVPYPAPAAWLKTNGLAFSVDVPQRAVVEATWPMSSTKRVIWPGFAINTIFYAVLLWLLWITPGTIRRYRTRLRRMREHRCLACNYQIAEGVGPNCSECGAKLPAKWRSQIAFERSSDR